MEGEPEPSRRLIQLLSVQKTKNIRVRVFFQSISYFKLFSFFLWTLVEKGNTFPADFVPAAVQQL